MDWRPNATQLSSLSPSQCRKLLGQTGKPATGLLPFLPGLAEAQAPHWLSPRIQKPWQRKQNVKLAANVCGKGWGRGLPTALLPPPRSYHQSPLSGLWWSEV